MERLTTRSTMGSAYYPYCFREDTCGGVGCSAHEGFCEFSERVCERLAAYEDTGLAPEQIVKMQEELARYKLMEDDGK